MTTIHIKRAYEPAEASDGFRILVDRLWPRGITKEEAHFDVWLKEAAPSTELRKWYHGHLDEWEDFNKKYKAELSGSDGLKLFSPYLAAHPVITLVYASKDNAYNHAVVLKRLLENK